jgi:WD40 repeat protein
LLNKTKFLFALLLCVDLFAQQPQTKTASEYYELAKQAYKEKDYQSYEKNLVQTIEAGSQHPVIYYNLAGAEALLGKKDLSVKWLNHIADFGITMPLAEDKDFESIRNSAEFAAVLKRFEGNLKPTDHSTVGFTIPQNDFLVEGVAYDPLSKTFYFGSILKKKIISMDSKGKVNDFSSSTDSLWSVLGMSVDAKRRILWASSAMMKELGNAETKAAIFKYDLSTKKLISRFDLPPAESGNVLGDVIVNSLGDAYTTDSITPAVYVIPHDGKKLELFVGGDLFRSPQGLCFSPDEKTLFVADYVRGIYAFDIKSKSSFKLQPPDSTTIVGVDGLYFYKNSLIATQNGINPNRVIRIYLNDQLNKIEQVKILESNNKLFDEITLGTIADGNFYYVGNSQFGKYLENPKAELHAPLILKLSLNAD